MFSTKIDPELLPMVRISRVSQKVAFVKGESKSTHSAPVLGLTRGLLDDLDVQETELFKKRLDWIKKGDEMLTAHPKPECPKDGPRCAKCQEMMDSNAAFEAKAQSLQVMAIQAHLRTAQELMRKLGTELSVQFLPGPSMTPVEKRVEASLTNTLYNRTFKRISEGRPIKACVVCSAATGVTCCSGCKFVYYCGKEHQTANWELHKQVCKTITVKSTVECCECQKERSVWHPIVGIWTVPLDYPKTGHYRFLCGKCRAKPELFKADVTKLYPRKLWPVCKSGLMLESMQQMIQVHSTTTEKIHVVDL